MAGVTSGSPHRAVSITTAAFCLFSQPGAVIEARHCETSKAFIACSWRRERPMPGATDLVRTCSICRRLWNSGWSAADPRKVSSRHTSPVVSLTARIPCVHTRRSRYTMEPGIRTTQQVLPVERGNSNDAAWSLRECEVANLHFLKRMVARAGSRVFGWCLVTLTCCYSWLRILR